MLSCFLLRFTNLYDQVLLVLLIDVDISQIITFFQAIHILLLIDKI